MVAEAKKSTLPKWLIAEDVNCTRWFIVHTEFPRFIGEIFDDDETGGNIIGLPKGKIEMIDQYPISESAGPKLAKLMREAGEALIKYDETNDRKAEQAKREEEEEEY